MGLNLATVLRQSMEIVLRHRVLWLYGFLLTLLGGDCLRVSGSSFDLSERQAGDFQQFLSTLDPNTVLVVALAAATVVLVLWVISIVVGNWATGALLGGIQEAAAGGRPSFGTTSAVGWRHFWPMLVIGLISGVIALLALLPFLIVVLVAVVLQQYLFLLTLCLWVPLLFVFFLGMLLVVTIAQVHVVVADSEPLGALRFAWDFVLAHLGDLLLVWLANDVAIGCGVGCLLSAIASVAAIPAIVGFFLNPIVGVIFLIPALLVALLVAVVAGAVLVFRRAVWLLTYQALQQGTLGEGEDQPPEPEPAA